MHSNNLELVTVMECISAAGAICPPLFILSDSPLSDTRTVTGLGSVSTFLNGWTNRALTLDWFIKVFIPFATSCCVNDKPIVLTLDGHDSHETLKMQQAAFCLGETTGSIVVQRKSRNLSS